jgi:hypothetical protein
MDDLFEFAAAVHAEAVAAGITLPMTEAARRGCTWGDPTAKYGTTITYCPSAASTGHAWLITSEDGGGSGNTAAAAAERARANGVAV